MADLKQSAKDWLDAREKQAADIADRLRSTARQNAPLIEQTAANTFAPTVGPAAVAVGPILKQGLTPTTPTAEDKLTGTPPPPPPPPPGVPAQPQQNSVLMPTAGGGGGSSRSSTSVTQGAQIAPETRALLDQSEQEQVSALKHGEQATEQTNAADAEQAGRTATYMEKQRLMSEMDPVALHKQHAIAEARQNVADLQNERVDTQHFQKSQNLGQKLAWAVGMAFGGFASGMRGGPNTAAQLYSQAIQDDINAQRDNIGHKTDVQKGLLGDLQADFKDYKQQDAAAQIVGMNVFVKKLEAERATTKNATAQANLDMEIAHAKDIMAQRHVQLDEATSNKVTKNFETVSGGGAKSGGITPQEIAAARQHYIDKLGEGGAPVNMAEVDRMVAAQFGMVGGSLPSVSKGGGETAVTLPGGQQANAPSKEAAKEYRDRIAAWNRFQQKVDQMEQLRAAHHGGATMFLSPADKATYEALSAAAKDDYSGTFGSTRAPTEGQLKILEDMMPRAEYGLGGEGAKMENLKNMAANGKNEVVQDFLNIAPPPPPPSGKPNPNFKP